MHITWFQRLFEVGTAARLLRSISTAKSIGLEGSAEQNGSSTLPNSLFIHMDREPGGATTSSAAVELELGFLL